MQGTSRHYATASFHGAARRRRYAGPVGLSVQLLALVCAAAAVAACVQGAIGFGLGMLTAPLLALVDPAFVPFPLLAASFPLSALVAYRERGAADWRGLPWMIAGRLPGTALGALVVVVVAHRVLGVLVAGAVLAAVAASVVAPRFAPTPRVLLAAGVASGFMGTASSVGGAPIALVYQHAGGPRARATLSLVFVFGTAISMVVLALAGAVHRHELALTAILLPGTLVGFLVSAPVARRLDRERMRRAVLGTAAAAAVALLASSLA